MAVGVLLSSYVLVDSTPCSFLDGPSKEISGKSIQALVHNSDRVQSMFDTLVDKYFEVEKSERTKEAGWIHGGLVALQLSRARAWDT